MSVSTSSPSRPAIVYPESDGKPMADNTKQYRAIVTIQGGIDNLYRDDPNVFVAGDLFWYPVEGQPGIVTAPDVLVAFGRPKGDRGCYKQWEEGGIAPQVVFEILSPSNTTAEMERKLRFYERYGVEEYYLYDPDGLTLKGWRREGDALRPIAQMQGWISPQLNVRFELGEDDLRVIGPDGRPFASYVELARRSDEAERQRADAERRQADAERLRAEAERRAEEDRQQAERLAARLRELGEEVE